MYARHVVVRAYVHSDDISFEMLLFPDREHAALCIALYNVIIWWIMDTLSLTPKSEYIFLFDFYL